VSHQGCEDTDQRLRSLAHDCGSKDLLQPCEHSGDKPFDQVGSDTGLSYRCLEGRDLAQSNLASFFLNRVVTPDSFSEFA